MGSVYRDRYDDSRTSISSARRDGGGYTTVKRYVVKDDDVRSNVGRDRRFVPDRPGERVEETRIVRREREVEDLPVRDTRRDDNRYSTNELVIRRDNDDDRRGSFYRREEPSTTDRELVIRRTTDTEPRRDEYQVSRFDDRRVTESRYRDEYDVGPARGGFDDRDLQRYTRNTEYFAPAPPPQTIIIKQEPIIIRERAREDDYQMIRRQDIEEEKSIVRREPSPQREEEFLYEKKIRERIDEQPRRRERSEDSWRERRSMRREVSPHDSVSQVGGGRRQRRGSYSSDDSMVYVRRTKESYDDDSRGSSPHQKRNLAAGVVAGIGAAELLRNHKKKEGRDTSHGVGRLGRDVGAGALGAIAAEGISRARSQYRSRSRRRKSRGRSDSRSRSRSRQRSRSRSASRSKLKTLGALGLGAAALATAAAVAQKKMSKNKEKEASPDRGRSSSRPRHGETVEELANDPTADDARNPKHRNIRMAEAGAAGAAITALLDRARSKSRGRDRSKSRVRQAVPVVAAGLGSAAIAGLYEKNKAKKEAETIAKEERREARRQSRSRSRQRSEYYDGPSQAAASDPRLIEYGDGPMHGSNFGPDYYGRPAPQEAFYASQSVVPAAAGAAGGYGAAREVSRDRRSRSRSVSSSPGGHRRRRNRSRDAATAAAAAGVGAVAASEYERRKAEKRERKARRREQEQHDPYEDTYNPQYTPQQDPYADYGQPSYYPQTSQFPPPPGSGPQPFPATAPTAAPPGAAYDAQAYQPPPPPPGAPPGPGYDAYASGANPYAPRRSDENVSVPPNPYVPNGVNTSRGVDPSPAINVHPPSTGEADPPGPYIAPTERAPSPDRPRAMSQPPPTGTRKSVQFAEKPDVNAAPESEASSPEQHRHRGHRDRTARGYEAGDDTDSTPPDDMRRRAQKTGESSRTLDPSNANGDEGRKRRHHHRRRSADPSSAAGQDTSSSRSIPRDQRPTSPADSDATVELPSRFDDKGRRKPETGDDPIADRIDEILKGKGVGGKLFGNFVDGIFGPEGRKKGKERER